MAKLTVRVLRMASGRPCIVATSREGEDALFGLVGDREVIATVKGARNPRHHRLFFKALAIVNESGAWAGDQSIGAPDTVDGLLKWIKKELGHYDVHVSVDENDPSRSVVYREFRSISFESMAQAEFAEFFDRACTVLCRDLLGSDDWKFGRRRSLRWSTARGRPHDKG